MKGTVDLQQFIHLFTYCMHGSGQPAGLGFLLPLCGSQGLNQAISLAVSALILSHLEHPLLGDILLMSVGLADLVCSVRSLSQAEPRSLRLDPAVSLLPRLCLALQLGLWPPKTFTPHEFSKAARLLHS